MDFLDSIDVDSTNSVEEQTHRKARRVRSWYLYEQFKALEKNQKDATLKLKDRLYQGPHLHQELRERRERRRLIDEFSMSDSGIDRFSSDIRISVNDSFRSFSDFHNVPFHNINQTRNADTSSLEESQDYPNQTGENIGRTVDTTYNCNYKHNVIDVVETKAIANFTKTPSTYGTENFVDATDDINLADDIKESLEHAKKIIAENINLQLETVKENLQCLEEFTKLNEDDALAEFDEDHKDASVTSLLQKFVEKFDANYKDASVTTSLNELVEKCHIEKNNKSVTTLLQNSMEKFDVGHEDASVILLLQDSAKKFDVEHKDSVVTTLLQDSVKKFDVEHKDADVTILLQDPVQRFNVDHKDAIVTPLLQTSVERPDEYRTNLFSMWSKFVSFAYQLVKLNHGNCYYEYSSQVLTAILACDVLCRGLHRMSNILQPYVSPIKYIDEDDEPQPRHKRDAVNIERHQKIPAIPTKAKKSVIKKESKKSCRSVWKNMSNSPIIFHICGDTPSTQINDTQRPTSSERRRNSNYDTRCPTSSECQRIHNNDIWRATSSECQRRRTYDTRCTSGECRRNSAYDTRCSTSSEFRRNSNSDTRRPTTSDPWQSRTRTTTKESSTEKSASTLWPEELRYSFSEDDAFTTCRKVTNPMLKLANYIDTLLKDVGDSS